MRFSRASVSSSRVGNTLYLPASTVMKRNLVVTYYSLAHFVIRGGWYRSYSEQLCTSRLDQGAAEQLWLGGTAFHSRIVDPTSVSITVPRRTRACQGAVHHHRPSTDHSSRRLVRPPALVLDPLFSSSVSPSPSVLRRWCIVEQFPNKVNMAVPAGLKL